MMAAPRSSSQRLRAGMAAELLGLLRGRRQAWVLVLAIGCSLAGGLVNGGIASQLGAVGELELATAAVSRGAATPIAVTLLAALVTAGSYRDGTWLHATLAEPRPLRRAVAGGTPMLGVSLVLGLVSAAAAGLGASLVAVVDLGALALAICLHLAVTLLWAVWMHCLAHATRSPMLTLVIGVGMPVMLEPAIAGLLAQQQHGDLRWVLPGQALRAIGEAASDGDALLLHFPPLGLLSATAALVLCTLAAVLAAGLRMRAAQPR